MSQNSATEQPPEPQHFTLQAETVIYEGLFAMPPKSPPLPLEEDVNGRRK